MITKQTELKTYQVDALCECGGLFVPDENNCGEVLCTYPPIHKYHYVCNKCGKKEIFSERYPHIVYEEIKNA